MAKAIFVAVVMLAGIKDVVWVVSFDIGFERPVLIGSQTRRSSRSPEWNDVEIDQVLIVAGCMGVEFAFRDFLSAAAWHRHSIPMGAQIDQIEEFGADREKLPRGLIILGLKNDQKRTVFVYDAALLRSRETGRRKHAVLGHTYRGNRVPRLTGGSRRSYPPG